MKQTTNLLLCYSFLLTFNTNCMESNVPIKQKGDVLIKTADQQLCTLQQWKVENSRLLHEKQAWQHKLNVPCTKPLVLNTINKQQLDLFSRALDAQNFNKHFHMLTPEQRKRLTCLAGATELNSSILTIKLLGACLEPNIIEAFIYPHFPEIRTIQNHLKRSIIINNVSFTSRFTQTTCSYANNKHIACRPDGFYITIPKELALRNFDGYSPNIQDDFFDNNQWLINCVKDKNQSETYFITPTEPAIQENPLSPIGNKKNLWLKNHATKNAVIKKVIEHTHEIDYTIFSNDGNYLATSSYKPNSELILTNLTQQENMPAFSSLFLKEHIGKIGALCFNNRSTLLAVGSENGIQLWDIKKGFLFKKLDCPQGFIVITNLRFNNDDTRLAASIAMEPTADFSVVIWDTSNLTAPEIITTLSSIDTIDIDGLKFSPCNNTLIITTNHDTLIINGTSGEKIIKTQKIFNPNAGFCFQTAVLMPDINLLATATLTNEKHCDTRLWDISSKQLIAILLRNVGQLTGVGVTDNSRSVISTSPNYTMTKTDLYDNNAANCFDWIINKTDLLQKYLLLRLYRAQQIGETVHLHKKSTEYNMLQALPTTPFNTKKMVKKYLLKKTKKSKLS